MSAPRSSRCVAKEWRNVCGVTLLPRFARERYSLRMNLTPRSVTRPPRWLMKRAPATVSAPPYRCGFRRLGADGRTRRRRSRGPPQGHVVAAPARRIPEEHVALLRALSHDPCRAILQVHVGEVQGHELRDAAPRGVQRFQDGPVTELPERVPVRACSWLGISISRAISSSKRNEGSRFSVRRLRISAKGLTGTCSAAPCSGTTRAPQRPSGSPSGRKGLPG